MSDDYPTFPPPPPIPDDPDDREARRARERYADRLFEAAIRCFGTTDSPIEAGFLLPDGTMIDFSERNDGGGGFRSLDHRAVERFFDDVERSAALWRFVSMGAARLINSRGFVGADYHGALTRAQIRVLTSAVRDATRQGEDVTLVLETRAADGEIVCGETNEHADADDVAEMALRVDAERLTRIGAVAASEAAMRRLAVTGWGQDDARADASPPRPRPPRRSLG